MVVPSNTFFPGGQMERVGWVNNFAGNIGAFAPLVGLTPADVTQIQQDAQDYEALVTNILAAENFLAALRDFRYSLTEAPIGSPQPVYPPFAFDAPPNERPAGMFQRLIEYIDRIRAAAAFTEEMGSTLHINPSVGADIPEADVKPTIQVFPSQTDYTFSIVVSKRANADSWTVMLAPKGGTWASVGTFTGKSADVEYAPATSGEPIAVEVRVQLKRKNEKYGQMSDIVPVTLNP